jgi:type IV secretion system protein VirB3
VDEPIAQHPLFVGLTRPPMYFGVTLNFFMINGFICLVLFVATMRSMLALSLLGLLHAVGYLCCRVDCYLFHVLWGKLAYLNNKNRTFWQCQSYDPY